MFFCRADFDKRFVDADGKKDGPKLKVRIVDENTLNQEAGSLISKLGLLYAQYHFNNYIEILKKERQNKIKLDGEKRLHVTNCMIHIVGALDTEIETCKRAGKPIPKKESWMIEVRKVRNTLIHETTAFKYCHDGITREYLLYKKNRDDKWDQMISTSLETQPFLETALIKTEELLKKNG